MKCGGPGTDGVVDLEAGSCSPLPEAECSMISVNGDVKSSMS
jgi:hypothetical protein